MTSPFGGRSRRTNYLIIRLGLLVLLIVGGVLFHHQGRAYEVIRVVYLVAIVGFLVWRISTRQRGGARYRDPGPPPPKPPAA
jgi:hypothetical protein